MNKLDITKRGLCVLVMCLSFALCGCGSNSSKTEESKTATAETKQSEDVSAEKVMIDYGDAESFEAALNEGKNLEGKVVRFIAGEFHPQSKLGYNVWAGEHLNFVSSRNPDIQEGDTVTVKTTTIENMGGSWIINYEKVGNAVVGEDTITYSKPKETTAATTTAKPKTTTTATTTAKEETTEAETNAPEEPAENKTENTYEHNEYYDIVETALIKDSLGDTTVIHKVQAKQDTTISASLIAYGADGSVIGKDSDDIVLTKDKYNFFQYYFEGDISNAELKANFQAKKDSFVVGERNAVEMVRYDQSGEDLYVTFEQTGDELSSFAKFKLLFYKGDQIVGTEDGYFNISAKNLNGKGSTDVAEVWVYDMDFDRVEYVYEP